MSVRVVAPCRLHFGLFHVPVDGLTHDRDGRQVRKFGGLGLMIENPCVTVEAEFSSRESLFGSLANRASDFIQRIEAIRFAPVELEGVSADFSFYWPGSSITANGPPEHVGLGVGTALGMAVGAIYHANSWNPSGPEHDEDCKDFARRVGRGLRSGIGIAGFSRGGFLLDQGKLDAEEFPRNTRRHVFPPLWRVVLVRPPTPPAWFGDRERTAFARGRDPERAWL